MEICFSLHPVRKNHDHMKKLLIIIAVFIGLTGFKPDNSRRITGTVYAIEDKLPIPGVTIRVSGTKIGTQTDGNGAYTIVVPEGYDRLNFSFIGYTTQEIKIGKKSKIDAFLKASGNQLGEVVVTGYAAQRRQDMTGSVAVVSADNAMLRKAAGLQAQQANAQRLASKIMIRGNAKDKIYNAPQPADDESYKGISENTFSDAKSNPLSTFSVDVDAASYSNVRRFINNGQLPPVDAVRIEEMINYFAYDLSGPTNNEPVAIHTVLSSAPWNTKHRLLRIGLKAKTIPTDNLPPSNLVFLIDVSGSMNMSNKLPLVQSSLKLLTDQLRPQDRVAIVVYAGNAGLVLPSTPGDKKTTINNAIDNLSAGGSTAGGEGLKLAYKIAKENYLPKGNNRVILSTDGDFNVGPSSDGDMEHLIENERGSNIDLSIMGFGMGNYKDSKMETMADKGNGNYAYIDNITEARKAFVTEFGGTLFTVAKDVKIQIEFNPAKVQAYRLLGYEDRLLNKEDFNNDKKDAGDMGSGHTVTALYEIVPAGLKDDYALSVDPLKYQKQKPTPMASASDEMMTIKFRYKEPKGSTSKLSQVVVKDQPVSFEKTSDDFRFATAVAEFGMLLRESQYKQNATFNQAIGIAKTAKGKDQEGYRSEFVRLAESARLLAKSELAGK
jgi:Ca-activated chloride channel family protein